MAVAVAVVVGFSTIFFLLLRRVFWQIVLLFLNHQIYDGLGIRQQWGIFADNKQYTFFNPLRFRLWPSVAVVVGFNILQRSNNYLLTFRYFEKLFCVGELCR